MSYRITSDCIQCGACELECPENAIVFSNNKFVIVEENCIDCGACSAVCVVRAIKAD